MMNVVLKRVIRNLIKKDIIKINPTKEQDTNKENILPEYMVYVNHNNFQDAGRL